MDTPPLDFFNSPALQVLGIIVFVLLFHVINKAIFSRLQHQFLITGKVWKYSFVSALYQPLLYVVWGFATLLIFDIISFHFLGFHLFNLPLILTVGGVLAFGWFLLRWNGSIIEGMQKSDVATPGKLDLLRKLGTVASILVTIFLLMDVTGHSLETLIAFGGIGGIALAFASQQFVSNLFGGVNIYLTQPFTVGDWINLPSQKVEGNVEEIGWYATCVRNFDKLPIYVPNSIFNQSIVINSSRLSYQRLYLKINVRQNDPILLWQATERIKVLLGEHPAIEHHMDHNVFFTKIENSFIEMEISAYISWLNKKEAVKQDILLKVLSILDALSIKTR